MPYRTALFAFLCVLTPLSLAEKAGNEEPADFPGIEKLMSAEQFDNSGLRQLSEQELEHLNQWLMQYTAQDAELVKRSSKTVKKIAKTAAIRSHIDGEFNGWHGKTVFRLANGQVWRQRLEGRHFHKSMNPEVIIRKNTFGFYVLELVETGKRVGVKRLD